MTVEVTWGPAAISEGFGGVQHVIDIIDFALLETDTLVNETPTLAVYSGLFFGEETFVGITGTGFIYDSLGGLIGGQISEVGLLRVEEGTILDIVTFTTSLAASDIANIIDLEQQGTDIAAIENFFGTQDWIYNGTSVNDFLPEGALSEDGVEINLAGDDVVRLLQGDDVFNAGDGNDDVRGASGNDDLYGGGGNDELRGSTGDDWLFGGGGDDFLAGQRDNDLMFGGLGDDRLIGGGGEDELIGDEGNDFLKAGFEGDFADGSDGDDIVNGNRGDDFLFGGAGNDIIRGGGDNDQLFGDLGNDQLKGGGGSDVFFVSANNGADFVTDWNPDEDLLVFVDTDVDNEDDESLYYFDENGINLIDGEDIIANFASVTAQGVLFDFGALGSMLLQGVTSLDQLNGGNVITLTEFDDMIV